jgi:hypothetical protein
MTSHHAALVVVAALALAAPGSYAGRNSALASAEEIYNVRTLGARGNGKTNDTPAIRSVIKAAPDGAIIYFPPGNYRCHGLTVADRERLTFRGAGPGSVIESPDTVRNPIILSLDQCRDIVFHDLTFNTLPHSPSVTVKRFGSGIANSPRRLHSKPPASICATQPTCGLRKTCSSSVMSSISS